MADITSATEYIPAPANPNPYASLPGGGPLTAASGNMGALQGALYKASVPMMDQESIDEVKDTLFSRVRSPEDIAAGKAARRGALSAYQEANTGIENDWSGDRYIAYGIAGNDKPWDVTHGVQKGIQLAMGADLEKQGKKYKAGLTNAAAGLEFEQGEEKIDDKIEGSALGDLTQMASSQSRINMAMAKGGGAGGAGGGGTRFKAVAGVGLVDTWAIDPQTGESKPAVVVKGPQVAQMTQKAMEKAMAEANSSGMEFNGPDGKPSVEARNNWIRQRTNELTGTLMMEHLDPQMRSDFTGQFIAPPPGGKPAGSPAPATATPAAAPKRYNVNAGEKRIGAGIAELGGAEANEPSQLPTIPAANDIALRNAADIRELEALIANPKVPQDAKVDAERTRQKLIAANNALMKGDIANIGRTPAPGVTTVAPVPVKPVAASAGMPGVTMKRSEDVKREDAYAAKQGTDAAGLTTDEFHKPAMAAGGTLSTVAQLREIPITPGAFANQKKLLGNVLESVGIKGSLVTEAGRLEDVSKLLAAEVNKKVRAEVGVQTDADVTRQAAESAKITDPVASYKFSLNQMEENAKRAIARSAFVKQIETSPEAAKTDFRTAWLEHSEKTLGPALQSYSGRPTFRSEFIKQAVKANPDMDPKEAEAAAAQAWLGMAKPKGKK